MVEIINKLLWQHEIAKALGEKIGANTELKKRQMERWQQFLDIEKVGRKYVVRKVIGDYIPPKEKKVDSIEKNTKHTSNELKAKGVYAIRSLKNNKIYIGSTNRSFKYRYTGHISKNTTRSKNILNEEHEFIILEVLDVEKDLLRRIESAYIYYYENYTDYEVVNAMNPTPKKHKQVKNKIKNIKVFENNYEKAIKLLKENGLLAE